MSRVLVIDNYDSFTYNLVHILRDLKLDELKIVRNDQFELDLVSAYDHVLLSPGPGLPRDAGLMPQIIERYASTKNILGVCLGHQGIGEAFGGELFNLPKVYHGVVTQVKVVQDDPLFKGIPKSFKACRYHSWVIMKESVGEDLEITSVAENGNIMSIRHREFCVRGVQFHPESIMTKHGDKMIKNWLEL